MNTSEVLLNIKGAHVEGGAERAMEIYTEGRLTREEDRYVLEYGTDDGATSAITRLIVDGPTLWLGRADSISSQIRLRETQIYETAFTTYGGMVQVSVLPTQVRANMTSDAGDIDLEYIVRVGADAALNRLNIHYQRRDSQMPDVS